MSAPVLPVVTRGPGILVFDGLSFYFDQSGAGVSTSRATEQTTDDFFGRLGETSHGTPVGEISLTPTGMLRSIAKLWPYGPATIEGVTRGWYSGQSIYTGAGYFHTKAGKKSLFARCGISKPPTMYLGPRKQLWGPMSFRYLNQINVQPTNAAALKTVSDLAFNDATFDESLIKKDIYTATLGTRPAPFNAMGTRDGGVEIEPFLELTDVPDDHVGMADTLVASVGYKCRFTPNNLVEAELDEMCEWQDTDAIIAGQDVAMLDEDLVIDADALTVTLHKVGVVKADTGFGTKKDRVGRIEFVNRMTFTLGVPDPLVTVVIN